MSVFGVVLRRRDDLFDQRLDRFAGYVARRNAGLDANDRRFHAVFRNAQFDKLSCIHAYQDTPEREGFKAMALENTTHNSTA